MIALAMAAAGIDACAQFRANYVGFWLTLGYSLRDFSAFYVDMALLYAAAGSLRARWRLHRGAAPPGPPAVPIGRFAGAWLALFAALSLSLPAVAALSFAIWLTAWRWTF